MTSEDGNSTIIDITIIVDERNKTLKFLWNVSSKYYEQLFI